MAKGGAAPWLRMLRVHQWAKNVLIFVPLIAAHQFTDVRAIARAAVGFVAFSLLASCVYIVNDIRDIEHDRLHPTKRTRPFASGAMPVRTGWTVIPVLAVIAAALAISLGWRFALWLLVYLVATTLYTFGLKRLVLIDAIVLAVLYTIRVYAGGAATSTPLSYWFVAFSIFLFLSLAFVKRYAELITGDEDDESDTTLAGRGYRTTDAPLIEILGVAAGFAAALVFAMYINSTNSLALYREPDILWATLPISTYWVSYMWLRAHRGEMHDDPVIFALRDPASWLTVLAFGAVLTVATIGWFA